MDALVARVASKFLGVDPLALRVARRFVADAIANPQKLLQQYDHAVRLIGDLEPLLPKMREAQKVVDAHEGEDFRWLAHQGAYPPHENELINFYFKEIYRIGGRIELETLNRVGAWTMFLALLQQYELPPTTRKAVETASKYFARSRIQKSKKPSDWLDAYEGFLKAIRAFSLVAHDALAHGKPRTGEAAGTAPEKVRAGPFTLVNTGGFDDSVISDCAKVVEIAAHQLQSHGLGKVCYGDVLISNTLQRANVLAFYLLQKDEMFVRANLRGKEGAAVDTVVHELGHRLQNKFLHDKQKEIDAIYATIARKGSAARAEEIHRLLSDPSLRPKIGDTFVSKGEEFTVAGFDIGSRGTVNVKLVGKLEYRPGVPVKAKIPLEAYARAKGTIPNVNHSKFVTGYAAKSPDENFAEMVAYYCAGKLPPDQVEMLKAVIH